MDDIPALVEDFFTASATGTATQNKFRDLLPVSIGFLLSTGVKLGDIPNDNQIKQLDDYLQTVKNIMGKFYSASTIGDWKSITAKFFTFNAQKGEAQMTIPEDTITADIPLSEEPETDRAGLVPEPETIATENTGIIPAQNSALTAEKVQTAQPDETPIQQEMTDNTQEKRKPGRPIKGDEGRDKKITVNIPTSIFLDIKDMANIDNVTFPDCVNAILENAVNDRWDDIQAIRALRARRH